MSRRNRRQRDRPAREVALDAAIVGLSVIVGLLLLSTLWRGLTSDHRASGGSAGLSRAAVGASGEEPGGPRSTLDATARAAGEGDRPRAAPGAAGPPIRVQVLNGCGVNGAGRKMTSVLRQAAGLDVIEIGNAESMDFDETVVVDRVGDGVAARAVARAIGDPPIVLQRKGGLPYMVTVIVGYDGGRWKGTLAGELP